MENDAIAKVHRYIDENFDRSLTQIMQLLAQPSISASGEGIGECVDLLSAMMREAGIETRVFETPGNPIIFGELASTTSGAETVLFYGHYDVQPPEPLELWTSPPFEPTVREGKLFARGVADNKGQLIAHILAVQAFRATGTAIPANLKFIFEGEEESGSASLPGFVKEHRDLLACDIVLPVDGSMLEGDILNVRLGCRGVVNFEIELETASIDNHSGLSGGVVPNVGWALVNLLATMKDENDAILIEGFMDAVQTPSAYDLAVIEALPYDPAELARVYGVPELPWNKKEFYTRLNLLPTLTINGIDCGYRGKGSKTVNPGKASVKLDARLVADQDPDSVVAAIKKHVAKHAPGAKVTVHGVMKPSKTDGGLPVCRAVLAALEKVYGNTVMVALGSGGSLPNYVWTDTLGVPALGIPYANQDANNHAPDENVKVSLLGKGIHASAQIMYDLGR